MIPRQARQSRPAFTYGAQRLPALPTVADPTPAALRSAALGYATEHATAARIRPGALAVAVLDAIAREHRLIPGPIGGGRWSSAPPPSWFYDLRDAVAARADRSPEPSAPF